MKKIWRCKDCEIIITKNRIRCRPCYEKTLIGKGNPRYLKGFTLKQYKCKKCNKNISYQSALFGSCMCRSCINKINSKGKNNPNYIDGRSFEVYPQKFNNSLKELIKFRDNFKCCNCHISQFEHFVLYDRDITIHHIDYNRKNCKDNNLITLCLSCNVKANKNRNKWKEYYKEKIRNIYATME